jgi:hypothetical protein
MQKQRLTASIAAHPVLERIPFPATNTLSPWIERATGFESFEKPQRDAAEILREYNDGHYKDLLDLWERFIAANSHAPLHRFFNEYDRYHAVMIEERKHIYRSSAAEYLFSVGDEFYKCDLTLGTMMFRDVVTRTVDDVLRSTGATGLVELGCGIGINVLSVYHHSAPEALRGGDICSNAVELGNRMARQYSIPATFNIFDYRSDESLRLLTSGMENYVLITVHSIEQVQVAENQVLERICRLPHPPKAVIHFEPVVWPSTGTDGNMMDKLCRRYAELNKYNMDLYTTLERLERDGVVEMTDVRKRVWGISPLNPTNIIAWKPC